MSVVVPHDLRPGSYIDLKAGDPGGPGKERHSRGDPGAFRRPLCVRFPVIWRCSCGRRCWDISLIRGHYGTGKGFRRMKISTAGKVLGLCVLLIVLSGAVAAVSFVGQQERFLQEEFEMKVRVLTEATAMASEHQVVTGDLSALARTARKFLRQEGVAYVRIISPGGKVLFSEEKPLTGDVREYFAEILPDTPDKVAGMAGSGADHQPIGMVALGVSQGAVHGRIGETGRAVLLFLFLFVVTALILMTALVRAVLQKPIDELMRGVRLISSGDLEHRVAVRGDDELGRLAQAFNRMIDDLKRITVSRDHVDSIIESMTDALVVIDMDGRVSIVNRAAKDLWSSLDLIGMPAVRLVMDDRLLTPAGISAGGRLLRDVETVAVTGTGRVPVLVSGAVLAGVQGQSAGIVALFKDITERKRIEDELRQTNQTLARNEARLKMMLEESRLMQQELVEARDKLVHSEKMASLGQISAGIAHEINNPLGFVMSNIQTLRGYVQSYDRVLDEVTLAVRAVNGGAPVGDIVRELEMIETRAGIQDIRGDIKPLLADVDDGLARVKQIVMDLKGFAHVDQGGMDRKDIRAILESAIAITWNLVKYKADLVRDFQDVPDILCNEFRLGQVFVNLLVNAVQAIEQGHGEIRLSTRRTERQGRDGVLVQVADTGKGIPPENLKKIFDPFFSTKPVGQGTGLGLSICYDIVKQYQGEITVASESGKGAVFSVFLPLDAGQPESVS